METGKTYAMEQHSDKSGQIAVEDDAADRQDSRDSLFLMADLRVPGHETALPVRVRNLSASGLMADFPGAVAQGARVDVEIRGIGRVTGQIAWSVAGRIGMAFDYQIDPLLARKPVGQGAHTPVFAKPTLVRGKPR